MTAWDFPASTPPLVITDNAKYRHAKLHCGWRQEHEPQFHLDYLPPYSPDLNSSEIRPGINVQEQVSSNGKKFEFRAFH